MNQPNRLGLAQTQVGVTELDPSFTHVHFYHMGARTSTDSNYLVECMMERCREWMRKG